MRTKIVLSLLSVAALSASAFAQTSTQTATTLPANIVTDQGAAKAAQANLQAAAAKLKADRTGNNANELTADRAALGIARLQLEAAMQTLRADAQAYLQTDRTQLMNLLSQLHTDASAGNATAVTADETALKNAHMQLAADMKAVYSGLGHGMRHHHAGAWGGEERGGARQPG